MSKSPFVGRFVDVVGLSYRSGEFSGVTDAGGKFDYDSSPSAIVSFSIGSLELGTTAGKPLLNLIDLAGVENPTEDPRILNRGRLLYSLTSGIGFENPVIIDDKARSAIETYKSELNLDETNPANLNTVLLKIGQMINKTIKSIPHVRNHLRRAAHGFKVLRDIKIPVQDGNFVFADIYLPLDDRERYPVVVSSTIYGKRVVFSGPDVNDADDVAAFEKSEDDWFSTTVDVPLHVPNTGPWFGTWTTQRTFETIGTFNTFVWVPRGYAMVKVDPRGVSQTPGVRGKPGQETNDLFDAVEWAGVQPWSSGNVALAGNSYGANCQWPVAIRKPKYLKAIIPYAGDVDRYRDVVYMGGIPLFNYLSQWSGGVTAASPKWKDAGNMVALLNTVPFYNKFWEATQLKLEEISIPCFLASSQMLVVHNRGSFEAWRRLGSTEKHLQIVDGNYYGWPNREAADILVAFLDRHLKGLELPKVEPVGLQMRTGYGKWFWRTECEWPIPGTKYIQWFLCPDGGLRSEAATGPDKVFTYSADPEPTGPSAGATFISEPLQAGVELAGHMIATLHVSSTSLDADVVVSLWAIDETGRAIRFCVQPNLEPLAMGLLRASHRKTDPAKSVPWQPYHTHTEEDYAPLQHEEVVELTVEIPPATAVLRKGWKLRVDVTPSEEQPNIPGFNSSKLRNYGGDFAKDSQNSIHVGGNYINSITIPIIPASKKQQRL